MIRDLEESAGQRCGAREMLRAAAGNPCNDTSGGWLGAGVGSRVSCRAVF